MYSPEYLVFSTPCSSTITSRMKHIFMESLRSDIGGNYILKSCSSKCVKFCAIAMATMVALGPVFGIFNFQNFEWFYAGGPGGGFSGNLTSGMDADEDELWVAMYSPASPSAQQIHVYDANSQEWVKTFSGGPGGIPISIFSFVTIEEDEVITGGSEGAAIYDRSSEEWRTISVEDGLPSNSVYSGRKKDGEYWFGTNKGLSILDSSGNWRNYDMEDGLPNNKILEILFDGSIAWIFTENGLAKFDPETEAIESYTQEDGLPGTSVGSALKVGDVLWVAMKGGIARLNTESGDITSYTMDDGLLGTEWKDVAIFEDTIYFGCSKGINYIKRGEEDPNWKTITTKDGLPETSARKERGSDITHLNSQGDGLWIALWYEGLVRMTIPKGLDIVPIWFWIVLLAAIGLAALLIIRPGAEKGEKKKEKPSKRRKKTKKPSHEICGGVPKRELCNRCNFNTLRGGELYCSKYKKPIEYGKESE